MGTKTQWGTYLFTLQHSSEKYLTPNNLTKNLTTALFKETNILLFSITFRIQQFSECDIFLSCEKLFLRGKTYFYKVFL